MNIFYHDDNWCQTSEETMITFGGDQHVLAYQEPPGNHALCFHVHVNNGHAGPVIGILTARKADGTIAGNSDLFIKLQKKLIDHGGISYIFTPEDVDDASINGYVYLPVMDQWKKIKAPWPDLVYNRIPFRKAEQSEKLHAFFSALKLKHIPFFNPCFLDKYALYCLLQKHSGLKNFLPETVLVTDLKTLYSFLEKHPSVYLKPSLSAKGKGIFRLSSTGFPQLILEDSKGKETYLDFLDFWEDWGWELIEKQYLVQEEIHSAKYEGKKFDLRILAHANEGGYIVSGVGVRQAVKQDVTTHVPNGGKLLPYDLFHSEELDQFIALTVDQIGELLTSHYGFFGEFSIDAGISSDGNYYLYEVNSKPMSFDETGIEERKIEQLCRLFFQLAKMPLTNENPANEGE